MHNRTLLLCNMQYLYHNVCDTDIPYCIVQNSGGGKLWWIWKIKCQSPTFYPTKPFLKFFDSTVNGNFMLTCIGVVLLKFFQPMKKKPGRVTVIGVKPISKWVAKK